MTVDSLAPRVNADFVGSRAKTTVVGPIGKVLSVASVWARIILVTDVVATAKADS